MALETNGGGKENKPGLYRFPGNPEAELLVRRHAKFGSVHADAAVRSGYEWVMSIEDYEEQAAKTNVTKKEG